MVQQNEDGATVGGAGGHKHEVPEPVRKKACTKPTPAQTPTRPSHDSPASAEPAGVAGSSPTLHPDSESSAHSVPANSPSDTQNRNTNMLPASGTSAAGGGPQMIQSAALRNEGTLVGGVGGSSPQQLPTRSPVGTPTRGIDTLMGGQPLTETDERGNTRFYPVFVKSDGTQCPVSAEYLRAMGIEWPPPAPVHMRQDLESIASELYQQAVANSQPPANRTTLAPRDSSRDSIDPAAASALAQAGLRGRDVSPPFSPRAEGGSPGGSFAGRPPSETSVSGVYTGMGGSMATISSSAGADTSRGDSCAMP